MGKRDEHEGEIKSVFGIFSVIAGVMAVCRRFCTILSFFFLRASCMITRSQTALKEGAPTKNRSGTGHPSIV